MNPSTGTTYVMTTTESRISNRVRLRVSYTDGQGYAETAEALFIISDSLDITVDDNNNDLVPEALGITVDTSGLSTSAMISYQWKRNGVPIKEEGATSAMYKTPQTKEARAAGLVYTVEVVITDRGKTTTRTSAGFEVQNALPVIESIDLVPPLSVDEGEKQMITANATDPNYDTTLTYVWRVKDPDARSASLSVGAATDPATITFTPSDTFVDDTTNPVAEATVTLTLTVTDSADESSSTDVVVTVVKQDNDTITTEELGAPTRSEMILTAPTPNYAADSDGANDNPNPTYQWQRCVASETNCSAPTATYTIINNATNAKYIIPEADNVEGNRLRVIVKYIDGRGNRDEVVSAAFVVEPDTAIRIRAKVFLEGPLQ